MARRRTVLAELRTLERGVAKAYVKAIREKTVKVADIEAAVRAGDIEAIRAATELSDDDLAEVIEKLREAAIKGGELEKHLGKQNINPNGEAMATWLQQKSSTMVTALQAGQRDAIAEIMATNGLLGVNPRSTALDIVGRIGQSGRREGGIIGLNKPQAAAVANARKNLSSGDPDLMRKYLQNERRDKRFDGIVRRRMAAGEALNQEELGRILGRYEDKLLKTRGETIARTETIEALSQGRALRAAEFAEQVSGKVMKEWASASDSSVRDDHREMDGIQVPVDQPFTMPDGSMMMQPLDRSLGAPAEQIINCRCVAIYRVEYEDVA